MPIHLSIIYGCFFTQNGLDSSFPETILTHKAENIYYLSLYKEKSGDPHGHEFIRCSLILLSNLL